MVCVVWLNAMVAPAAIWLFAEVTVAVRVTSPPDAGADVRLVTELLTSSSRGLAPVTMQLWTTVLPLDTGHG